MEATTQLFHGPHVFSLDAVHSFNFDKKLNAALRHSSKRLDIAHQCLQIRTHISHKITKQVNALQSSHAKSFDLGDITIEVQSSSTSTGVELTKIIRIAKV